jgi:hypothetical protein
MNNDNKIIFNRILEILNISDDNYVFYLDDLENSDKKEKILELEKNVFNTTNILNKNIDYKRRYLSFISVNI